MKHKRFFKRALAAAASLALAFSPTFVPQLTLHPAEELTAAAADSSSYADALAMSLYFFDANACGTGITDGPLTWRGDCHPQDQNAPIGDLDSSLRRYVDPDWDGMVDVSGGFHDAGDHIKFNLTIGFAMSSLAMSAVMNPEPYQNTHSTDHLLYELRRGADYLMKTTFLDDNGNVAAIAHVVADGDADHRDWLPPEEQTGERPIYWLTAGNNNTGVCGMMSAGLAGTAYLFKEKDPAYAEVCLDYAQKLLKFGMDHPGSNQSGIGSFYNNSGSFADDIAWAKAWMRLHGQNNETPFSYIGNGMYRSNCEFEPGQEYYDCYLFCWDKVWQGYAAFMYWMTGDNQFAEALQYAGREKGGLQNGSYNAYGVSWGASRYNCAMQFDSMVLNHFDPESEALKACRYNMDYILGNNHLKQSFLIGYGDSYTKHVHHRAANPSGNDADYTVFGMLVGGTDPNGNFNDANAKEAYAYTEGALDYNACFAMAAAGLAQAYGSAGDALELMRGATELNVPFSFAADEEHVFNNYYCVNCRAFQVNETLFPDDAFRAYILEAFDLNGDGIMSEAEQALATTIDAPDRGISSLYGLFNFHDLEYINVSHNKLTSLATSWLPEKIRYADLSCNELEACDLANNSPDLVELNLSDNCLKKLDFSMLPNLKVLNVSSNELTELDLTKNIRLEELNCAGNQLACLNLDRCTNVEKLDAENNVSVQAISCDGILDLTAVSGIDPGRMRAVIGAEDLGDGKFLFSESSDTMSYLYQCNETQQAYFTITADKPQHSFAEDYHCEGCGGLLMNKATFPDETLRNYVYKHFDLNKNALLSDEEIEAATEIVIDGETVTDLSCLRYLPNVKSLTITGTEMTEIDLTGMEQLTTLNLSGNQLQAIDLTGVPNLTALDLSGNQLKTLDLKPVPELMDLNVCDNQLMFFSLAPLNNVPKSVQYAGNSADLGTLPCSGKITFPDDMDMEQFYQVVSGGELIDGTVYADGSGELVYDYYLDKSFGGTFTVTYKMDSHIDQNSDGLCDDCTTVMEGLGVRLEGYTVDVTDTIGVNYYMALDPAVLENKDAYMEFTLPGGTVEQELVSEAQTVQMNGKTYFVFSCRVAAKEMTEQISARIVSGEDASQTYYYTVAEYASYILDEENGYDEASKDLVRAMLNYGGLAQSYFGYNTEDLANAGIDVDMSGVTVPAAGTVEDELEGLDYVGSTLLLRSNIVLRHYFQLDENADIADFTFFTDEKVQPAEKDGLYYVEIRDIPVNLYDSAFGLSINNGALNMTYAISDYINAVMTAEDAEEALVATVKALALYGQAAQAYQASK